jgi:very-short-patch-repair endonuclease
MAPNISEARSEKTWELVRAQRGVVARRQLLALGFTPDGIKHRLRSGRLHTVGHGVYAVGRRELGREGRWMAALLGCGDGAFLSHRSAAALYKIAEERLGLIEVSVRGNRECRRSSMRVRTRPSLPSQSVGTYNGIPVTSPVQTLVDIAAELPPRRLERAVNEADKHGLVDPESLRVALDDHAGEPGVRPLRDLLDRDTFLLSDDELELLFRRLALEAGLPLPMTKRIVNGFEVDFYWPELGLVVETDGFRYHRTPSAQARDALRDQTHTAAGLTRLRFSHHHVKFEPTRVQDVLTRTAARLRAG